MAFLNSPGVSTRPRRSMVRKATVVGVLGAEVTREVYREQWRRDAAEPMVSRWSAGGQTFRRASPISAVTKMMTAAMAGQSASAP